MATLRSISMGRRPGILPKSLLFLLAASTAANAQFTPAPGSPFAVGTNPWSAAVGDFNGDGKPDLAVANESSNNVTVLLGNGSGGFTAASGSPFAAGANPYSVAVGDFNGDGKPDLAVANYSSNNVTVLLGNGSGGFTAASGSPFAVGLLPVSVAVGDFNGDGKPDLAVANDADGNVTVLLGNGSGGFTAASGSPFAAGANPFSVAVGDFNGDGKPDLAFANYSSNNVTVLLGNGSGGFTPASGSPFAVGTGPASVAVGDFNGDGKPDLAVANFNNVTVLLGNGSGGFTAAAGSPFAVGARPYSVAVADFNGDGNPDLAAANLDSDNVTVLLGNGSGGFTAASGSPFAVGTGPASVAVGDFNGDGKPDLAVANLYFTSNNVTVLLNTAPTITANPASMTFYAGVGQAVPAAIPVSVSSSTGGSTYTAASNQSWLTANPTSNATGGVTTVALSANPASLTAGTYSGTVRFTAPGFFDAATAVTFSLASPSGGFTAASGSPFAAGVDPGSVAVGDFNGDGKQDLAVANWGDSTVTVLLGNGSGGFTAVSGNPSAVGPQPESIAVGDFNGDGKPDLATANLGGNVTVLLGNGSGGFTPAAGSPFAVQYPWSVAVGDFNGDGKQDLAIASGGAGGGTNSNSVTVLLSNGSGGFTVAPGSPFAAGWGPSSVAVGDFNGDGKPDLAVTNYSSIDVTVLLGNGLGGFTAAPGSPYAVGRYPNSVAVGDLNGDGKPDLAVTTNYSGVTVLLGNGSGGFTPAPGSPFAAGTYPFSVAVGDFNGDGKPDLAVANLNSGDLTVLLGNGSGGFTPASGNPFAVGAYLSSVAMGDFNGDGRPDLAVANSISNNVMVLLGGLATTSSVLSTTAGSTIAYGTPAPLTLTVSHPLGGFNAPTGTATFLDGTTILGTASQAASPYTFTASNLAVGSHTLSASYGGDLSNIASSSNTVTIQVIGGLQYQLRTASSPAAGGTVSPASGAFYSAGSVVGVQATANAGYRFANFSGGLTGSANPQSITMNGPANVVANFTRLAPSLAASVGARTDVVAGVTRQVMITLTNTGAGPATNATIIGIGNAVMLGSGFVSVASGVPVDIGTIGTSAAANAAVIFNWPATATKVGFIVSFTADNGYSGWTGVTTLR